MMTATTPIILKKRAANIRIKTHNPPLFPLFSASLYNQTAIKIAITKIITMQIANIARPIPKKAHSSSVKSSS
jgi:hypothetical protein